jgi:choline dehydrogenase-like flavoprotein
MLDRGSSLVKRPAFDAKSLQQEASLEAEVAIVGAGPAGITLALELAEAGHRVLLIESGGDSFDADVQHLGDTVGEDRAHAPMSLATRRQIGGTSNLWAGRCVPFDPVDFERRAIVANADWPVDYAELESYFSRACEWCVCGEPHFDVGEVPELSGESLIPGWPEGDVCSTSLERWSLPTNFGREYRAELGSSPLIEVVSNLTCTEIVCAPDGRSVERLTARTLAGSQVTIRAKRYVLACGGVESTRLLFVSNRHHRGGIGNHSGHLGRWYMGHLGAAIAQVRFTTPADKTIYGFERDSAGVYVRRRFAFALDYLLEHDLPNTAMWLENPQMGDPSHRSEILSFLYLALTSRFGGCFVPEGIRRRKLDTEMRGSSLLHIGNILRRLPRVVKFALTFGYERYVRRGYKVPGIFIPSESNTYRLYYHGEHLPNYESYIAPTAARDALGVPRMHTNLRFSEEEIRNAIRAHEHFDLYLRQNGLGQLDYLYENREEAFREQLLDGYHQAGTTRMSERPEDGVVDARLAVHGFDDLFVASSSTFVTSGQANSTFMIVAFAIRLADHLHRSLLPESAPSEVVVERRVGDIAPQ